MAEGPPPLRFIDVQPLLLRLAEVCADVIIVGGQAVNFWAERYVGRLPTLGSEAPFTSKDLDFCGDHSVVKICAARLDGTAFVATMDDHVPNTGVVVYLDGQGWKRKIDVLYEPLGLRAAEVQNLAIPAELLDADGHPTGVVFRVMHPAHVLESRVHNVMQLPGYAGPEGLKQLRVSAQCIEGFVSELLDDGLEVPARRVLQRAFRFCTDNDFALGALAKHGIDPFVGALAALEDPRLNATFRTSQVPRMLRSLEDRGRGRAGPTR